MKSKSDILSNIRSFYLTNLGYFREDEEDAHDLFDNKDYAHYQIARRRQIEHVKAMLFALETEYGLRKLFGHPEEEPTPELSTSLTDNLDEDVYF